MSSTRRFHCKDEWEHWRCKKETTTSRHSDVLASHRAERLLFAATLYEMAHWLRGIVNLISAHSTPYIMTDPNEWLEMPVDGNGKQAVTGELATEAEGLAAALFPRILHDEVSWCSTRIKGGSRLLLAKQHWTDLEDWLHRRPTGALPCTGQGRGDEGQLAPHDYWSLSVSVRWRLRAKASTPIDGCCANGW